MADVSDATEIKILKPITYIKTVSKKKATFQKIHKYMRKINLRLINNF